MGAKSNVVHVDRVRCLECGTKYVKPAGGGTVTENPGCPKCGYVGWIATSVPASPSGRPRFAADLRPRRAAQRR